MEGVQRKTHTLRMDRLSNEESGSATAEEGQKDVTGRKWTAVQRKNSLNDNESGFPCFTSLIQHDIVVILAVFLLMVQSSLITQ